MNSTKEYNRCYIPKIVIKKNDKDDQKDPTIEAQENANEIIEKMKGTWKERSRKEDVMRDKNSVEIPQKMVEKRLKLDEIMAERNPPF